MPASAGMLASLKAKQSDQNEDAISRSRSRSSSSSSKRQRVEENLVTKTSRQQPPQPPPRPSRKTAETEESDVPERRGRKHGGRPLYVDKDKDFIDFCRAHHKRSIRPTGILLEKGNEASRIFPKSLMERCRLDPLIVTQMEEHLRLRWPDFLPPAPDDHLNEHLIRAIAIIGAQNTNEPDFPMAGDRGVRTQATSSKSAPYSKGFEGKVKGWGKSSSSSAPRR